MLNHSKAGIPLKTSFHDSSVSRSRNDSCCFCDRVAGRLEKSLISETQRRGVEFGIRLRSSKCSETSVILLDQLAKPTFRSHYAHTPFTEQSEGPMDTVASMTLLVLTGTVRVPYCK